MSRSSVLYIFQKTDLRLCDNRAIEKAFSFGLPVYFIACLDLQNEWNRRNKTTGFVATGRHRRRFYLECLLDIEKSLQGTYQQKNAALYISELSLSKTIAKLLSISPSCPGDDSGMDVDSDKPIFTPAHIVWTRESGTYEMQEEKRTRSILQGLPQNRKTQYHIIEDDTLVPREQIPFKNGLSSLPDQYTNFRLMLEKQVTKERFVPAREFVEGYCPKMARSPLPREVNPLQCLKVPEKKIAQNTVCSLSDYLSNSKEMSIANGQMYPISSIHNANKMKKLLTPEGSDLLEPTFITECVTENPSIQQVQGPNEKSQNDIYRGGETAALQRVHSYLWDSNAIAKYKQTRNGSLGNFYSTKFSMYLATGCISARTILHEIALYEEKRSGTTENTYWVLFELLWRDYFHLIMDKCGSDLFKVNGIQHNKKKTWNGINYTVPTDLAAFQKGRLDHTTHKFEQWIMGNTGFPIIDAWMRELALTGFMSNRGRQNVASFLVFNLQVDWRCGAEYFEHILLDSDPGSNYGNWQTIAGVGVQARDNIFNIIKQSHQYESAGNYMAAWLPALNQAMEDVVKACQKNGINKQQELRKIILHTPWDATQFMNECGVPADVIDEFRDAVPSCYLKPIVDPHKSFYYQVEHGNQKGGSKGHNKGREMVHDQTDPPRGKKRWGNKR